jgi:hypothetical protein
MSRVRGAVQRALCSALVALLWVGRALCDSSDVSNIPEFVICVMEAQELGMVLNSGSGCGGEADIGKSGEDAEVQSRG